MKKSVSALGLSLLFCISHSFAQQPAVSDEKMADRCLSEIQVLYKTNPESIALLKDAHVQSNSVELDRYDAMVGSQHVATELRATVAHSEQVVGQILCLIDDDNILYKTFLHSGR